MEDRVIDGTVHNYLYMEERAKYFDFIFPTMDLEYVINIIFLKIFK